jgi:hypothetical protein
MQKTTKSTKKILGYKNLVDPDTGEFVPMQMVEVEDRDFNFHKIWLKNFLNSVDEIVNQKARLALWIIDNLDSENKLVMTQREIAKHTRMSTQTVNRTLKALCKAPEGGMAFLQKMQIGAYRVNPEIIYKGRYSTRQGICFNYKTTAEVNHLKKSGKDYILNDITFENYKNLENYIGNQDEDET